MPMHLTNSETESLLRNYLRRDGYKLSGVRHCGETGVDIVASKNGYSFYIEVIGYKKSPPARSKDFYEVFFRAISRLNDGAKNIVIALPSDFKTGMLQRYRQYQLGWDRIARTFPELEIWFVYPKTTNKYSRYRWANAYI